MTTYEAAGSPPRSRTTRSCVRAPRQFVKQSVKKSAVKQLPRFAEAQRTLQHTTAPCARDAGARGVGGSGGVPRRVRAGRRREQSRPSPGGRDQGSGGVAPPAHGASRRRPARARA
jgi:hypothetical protein